MSSSTASWLRPLVSLFLAACFFLPLYLVLVNVFKPSQDIVAHPAALPVPATTANLQAVLDRPDRLFWYGLVNSVEITAFSVTIVVVLSAMLGHYLARTAGLAAKVTLLILLSGLTIPSAVIISSLTRVLDSFGLMGTIPGIVLADVGYYLPFGVFVFMGFVKTVPVEMEQAAAIDGAGYFRTFWQIVFPLMRPATASVFIFLGVWIWNDFLNPLIILGPDTGTTVTVGVYRAIGEHQTDFGALFAFMFLASLPVLVLFLLFQKSFVKGLTSGATKG
ncbi:carbohydrate ABC transporter permease [Yinghuangia seranimata]|uniref:carbohydrate ABC transporter permease n=1 Tax=Yinghuangia seranimata TaxID=408067 RepID=UPI00248C6195|nr:carbohydrate ABC transporter permease [Yinghuangia seranimata]MDI2129494.1 carbohydrate ABC transporter permease [Yinghuangia seranimata]